MRLVVIIGPPGAGKSTYVATERRPGDAAVDFDLMAQALGADLSHDAPPTVGKIAFAARQAAIARAFDSLTGAKDPLPGDVWVIASNLDDATRAEWQAKGAEIVVLDPGYDVVMQRLRDDGRPQASFDAAEAWYAANPSTAAAKEAPMLEMKSATLVVDEALEDGQFTAYASVFDVIDLDGDIVRKGAFAGIEDDGAGIPVYWAHRLDDPHMNIGATMSAVEDDHGLKTLTQLDLESPTASYAHRLVMQRRVKQLSYTYSVLEYRLIEVDGKTVREILRVKLHEISLVPIGANQMTEVLAAKAGITPKTTADAAEDVEHDDAEEHEVEEPETAKTEAKAAHARARIALAELGI